MAFKIVVCVLFSVMLVSIDAGPINPDSSGQCHHVQSHYFPYRRAADSSSSRNLCGFTSCCNGLDSAIEKKIQSDFASEMHNLLGEFANDAWSMGNGIHLKLVNLINETAERIIDNSTTENERFPSTVRQLFRTIESHIFANHSNNGNSNHNQLRLHSEELFTLILEQHYDKLQFPQDFITCMLDALKDSKFFGSIVDTFLQRIGHAIQTSSLIYRSLSLSSRLINFPLQAKLDDQCIKAVAKMSHCSHCSDPRMLAAENGRACESICVNTYQECLNNLDMVRQQQAWAKHVLQFEQMIDTLVDKNNPETIFEQLYRYISNEEYFKENDEIAKKVKVACGTPIRYSRGIAEKNGQRRAKSSTMSSRAPTSITGAASSSSSSTPSGYSQSFYVSLKSLSQLFIKNKNIFANLTSNLCHRNDDNNCWDGNSIVSSYRRTTTTVPRTVATNKENSELFEHVEHLRRSIESIQQQDAAGRIHKGYISSEEDSDEGSGFFLPDEEDDDTMEGSGEDFDYGNTAEEDRSIISTDSDLVFNPSGTSTQNVDSNQNFASTENVDSNQNFASTENVNNNNNNQHVYNNNNKQNVDHYHNANNNHHHHQNVGGRHNPVDDRTNHKRVRPASIPPAASAAFLFEANLALLLCGLVLGRVLSSIV